MKIKTLLAVFIGFSFYQPAMALDQIECWDGDCLKHGWTLKAVDRHGFTDYQCRNSDCLKEGWVTGGTLGLEIYSSCKAGGCFKEGWYEIDRWTQQTLLNVECRGRDCLTDGWISYSSRGPASTECVNNNCRQLGWRTILPGPRSELVDCLSNDCFHVGWIRSVR